MKATGYHVRNTLVRFEDLENLPLERSERIKLLTIEYKRLGYIDATTEIGPDQSRRQTGKQRKSIGDKALRVFAIEQEIKELLKSDEQLVNEAIARSNAEKQAKIQRLQRSIKTIETYCKSKIESSRMNATKKAYLEEKQILSELLA